MGHPVGDFPSYCEFDTFELFIPFFVFSFWLTKAIKKENIK